MGLEPYIFEAVCRDRQRQVEAEILRRQVIELERAASGEGRGAWRGLGDHVSSVARSARVRLSALMLSARRARPWRNIRGAGGMNGQGST